MFDLFNRVRERPHNERQVIALSIAAVITGIIFVLWIISFFASIRGEQRIVTPSSDTSAESAFSFDTLLNSFQEARKTIEKEVEVVQEQFEFIQNELQEAEEKDQELRLVNPDEDWEILVAPKEPKKEIKTETTPSGIEIIRVEN